jgi:hypothetical protein
VASRLEAIQYGTSMIAAMKRVRSRKLKRPKLASLTSHFMASPTHLMAGSCAVLG